MTDAYYASSALNSIGLTSALLSNGHTFPPRYSAPVQEVELEDDGQISCFCGFDHDDGNTVACDECNRWQHIDCYYPDHEGALPEALQHFCIECKPRDLDVGDARELQQRRKEQRTLSANGSRRQPTKSHKKKVKSEVTPAYTNGWPLDKTRHDRNSASPRDQQPPPAKRPKTSHNHSDSTSLGPTKGHSRKRNASTANGNRSLSQSPESPIPLYTQEFLHAYTHDTWSVTNANLHNGISVTNELTDWLRKSDDLFRSMHNVDKGEVLMRWDGDLDDIPGKAQLEIRDMHDESVFIEGQNPAWKIVTVQEPVASGGYIGELKGHVGFRKQYIEEPANRWSSLRHPEPFVFFHPKLPVYIDARSEGTDLRYVRRSCTPNARLQILVTEGRDCRFCFMATSLIEPGQEVSIAWDTTEAVPGVQNPTSMSTSEMGQFRTWASTVMANCGPCACSLPVGHECGFARLDRRGMSVPYDDEPQRVKPSKPRKRKVGQQVSPLDTHAFNSRSGSEVRRGDADDEPTDSRSASGSGGRGTISRDITPNTHYSSNGTMATMPELSERERKKLAKEEEMFRRQEEERTGKQGKKKRSSAGSSLNTPTVSNTKQAGFPNNPRYADAGTSRASDLPSAKSINGKRPLHKTSAKRAKTAVRPRPAYVDSGTQCDMDKEEAARRVSSVVAPRPKIKFISNAQKLFDRCARNKAILAGKFGLTNGAERASPKLDMPSLEPMPAADTKTPADCQTKDVHMDEGVTEAERPLEEAGVPTKDEDMQPAQSRLPTNLPPSPWPSKPTSPSIDDSEANPRPTDMHIDMPPPPNNPAGLASGPSSAEALMAGATVQSPASLLVPFSALPPSVKEAITPARKKLSLSDYTKRKATNRDHDPKAERDSSPASTTSGPIVPPLRPSSSEAVKMAEGESAVIEDDVKMEDAPASDITA